MHTLEAGLLEIVAGRSRGVPSAWMQTVLRRARDLDLSPFAFLAEEGIRTPDFFHNILTSSTPTFEEELAALAATPPEIIRADLHYEYGDEVPAVFGEWAREPAAALAAYVAAVRAWWEAVLAPSWPAISSALQSEVLRVGRLLATLSPAEALAQLHPRLLVGPHSLWVDRGVIFERHVLADRMLFLLPLAAGFDALSTSLDHPQGALIAYAAPGVQALLAAEAPPVTEDLVALLGEARARIILQLKSPASTTGLAATLGYAPSTMSSHLRDLSLMGLVGATRHAKYVFYERTSRAEGLVALYGA